MFGNTFVLPRAGGDITCVKINQDQYKGEYLFKNTTHQFRILIRHSKVVGKNGAPDYDRHNVEVVRTIFAAGAVAEYYQKAYFVVELLPGDTDVTLMDAIADWCIATSNANLTSLNGWES